MTKRQEYAARIIFLLVVLYSASWFVIATQMEKQLMQRFADAPSHGLVITSKRHHTTGFPFEMRVVFRDFSLVDKSGITINAPRFGIGMVLGTLDRITVSSNWGMFVTWQAGKQRPALKAAADRMEGGLELGANGLDTLSLTLTNAFLTGLLPDPKAIACETLSVFASRPDSRPANATDPSGRLIVNADNVLLPSPAVPALGNAIHRITLDATLFGTIDGMDQASLRTWSDAGGTVNVNEFSTEWGPLGGGLGGTMALDNDFQPLGSFSARITGFVPALDALAAEGGISPDKADLIKAGLGLIAQPEGDGNVPTLNVPLTIQDRALYVSSFRVLKLGQVHLY
jgi:hypothetical protein